MKQLYFAPRPEPCKRERERAREAEAGTTCVRKTSKFMEKEGVLENVTYLDLLENLPRWLLGVVLPPKGHREEIM